MRYYLGDWYAFGNFSQNIIKNIINIINVILYLAVSHIVEI